MISIDNLSWSNVKSFFVDKRTLEVKKVATYLEDLVKNILEKLELAEGENTLICRFIYEEEVCNLFYKINYNEEEEVEDCQYYSFIWNSLYGDKGKSLRRDIFSIKDYYDVDEVDIEDLKNLLIKGHLNTFHYYYTPNSEEQQYQETWHGDEKTTFENLELLK